MIGVLVISLSATKFMLDSSVIPGHVKRRPAYA
jgi:hypothetical protein